MSENKQVGQLDARCALDHSRQVRQYLERFNGQSFGVTENSVDRRNLGIALDNFEETTAMLMNMANRVIELEAAVLSASAGAGWMPIETAPGDTPILVGPTKRMGICVAMNHTRDGWVTETCSEWVSIYEPTHWMPIPPVPIHATNSMQGKEEK